MQRYYIPALGNLWASLESYALPILRAGLGIILMAHGCQKLFGMFGVSSMARRILAIPPRSQL